MKKKIAGLAVVASMILMSGCVQRVDSIKSTYVSPTEYEKLTCDQLKEEALRVNKKLSALSKGQTSSADKDTDKKGTKVLFLPPVFLFIATQDDKKSEIGSLKGQYDAIRDVATKKNCSFAEKMR